LAAGRPRGGGCGRGSVLVSGERLHELLLAELHAADQLEWERAVADSSYLQAKKIA